MKRPDDHVLIIFGASGDLTKRKLIPALYDLYQQDLLPENFAVLGVSRTKMSCDEFRERAGEFLPEDEETLSFKKFLFYEAVDPSNFEEFKRLTVYLNDLTNNLSISPNYIFYLSLPPAVYSDVAQNLHETGLSSSNRWFRRLIVEKPFGVDLNSAIELNRKLLSFFDENQLYRIDHYLGKESVQNMLVTRFANGIFEPLWNRNFIEKVEITSAESLGVEGRGSYYEHAGALRDMLQNHLLQLVGFVAMEPPVVVGHEAIRNEIVKVFQSLRPVTEEDVPNYVVRGQYTSSTVCGTKVLGYRDEPGVDDNSRTETYVAMKFFIDNWRWGGVPFYIRTGKKLPARVTEIVIHFRQVPHHLFDKDRQFDGLGNKLIIRIQPDEGILLKFGMKRPGSGFTVKTVNMDFHYSDLAEARLPSAYERLLLDCMQGDATLYLRGDAVEQAWTFVQPVLNAWENSKSIPLYSYPAGSWGPEIANDLIDNGEGWRYPCKNLTDEDDYCEL